MLRIVEFKTEYRAGRDPVDMVCLAPQGPGFEKTRTWHRVKDLNPELVVNDDRRESLSFKDMEARWSVIGPAYTAWRSGNELPETGTPLAAWSGVTPEQAAALRSLGIRTVEDVRDMGDAAMSKLHMPNARQLPKLAAEFLSGAGVAEKDNKIADLEARLAAMQELLEENMAEKPKRGRPRKEEVEAA